MLDTERLIKYDFVEGLICHIISGATLSPDTIYSFEL